MSRRRRRWCWGSVNCPSTEKEVDGISSLSRRIYSGFGWSAFDVVLDSIEKELLSEEFEEVALDALGDVWLEV